MTEALTPTSGSAWRAMATETAIIKLPYSQAVVEVGSVQLDHLLVAGKIPDLLTPLVVESLWSPVGQGKSDDELGRQKGYYELVDIVVTAALRSPRVVENPTADDEIAIAHIPFLDKVIIYQAAIQPLGVLHRFRAQQESDVDALPEGEDLQPATE